MKRRRLCWLLVGLTIAQGAIATPRVSTSKSIQRHEFGGWIRDIRWVGDERDGRFLVEVDQESQAGDRFHVWLVNPDGWEFKDLGLSWSVGPQQAGSFADLQTGPTEIQRFDFRTGKRIFLETAQPIQSFCFDRNQNTFCYLAQETSDVLAVDERGQERKLTAWLTPDSAPAETSIKPQSIHALFQGSCLIEYQSQRQGEPITGLRWVSTLSGKPQGNPFWMTEAPFVACSTGGSVTVMDEDGKLKTRLFRNAGIVHQADMPSSDNDPGSPIKLPSSLASPEILISKGDEEGGKWTITYYAYSASTGKLRKVWKRTSADPSQSTESSCISADGKTLALQTGDKEVEFIHFAKPR